MTAFAPGQTVKLLVGFLAWRWIPAQCGRPDPEPNSRFFATGDELAFAGEMPGRPGCGIVRTPDGRLWKCPLGFLAP